MAHNIEYNATKGTWSMFSLKETAWHGLGQVLPDKVSSIEALRLANLDYRVEMAPLYANLNHEFRTLDISNMKEVNNIFATYRSDTNTILGTVGSKYEVVQNEQALDFIFGCIEDINIQSKEDIVIETAGALGIGERIFVTAKVCNYKIDSLKEDMEQYIVFTTSHDGSSSVQAMFTTVRVVCNNTLNAAIKQAKNIMSFRHTKRVKETMKIGASIMNNAILHNSSIISIMDIASKKIITDKDVYNYIGNILIPDIQQREYFITTATNRTAIDTDIISTRKMNTINNVLSCIENGVGQDTHRGTALWLYNGVTTYLNNGVDYNTKEDKFNSMTRGLSYKLNQSAMDNLIRLSA